MVEDLLITSNIFCSKGYISLDNKNLFSLSVGVVCFLLILFWAKQSLVEYKSNRDSNIELCRIVCMLGVIMHHFVVHGGTIFIEEMCLNKIVAYALVPFGKLAFDCFLAISCWYLVDQQFKTERFLKTWFMVLFYSVTFAVVSKLMGSTLALKDWFAVLLPIAGNSHGFAASYLMLYLLIPFLNRVTKNVTKKQARYLMYLLLYIECGTQIIGYFIEYRQPMSSEIVLFVLIYFIALNLKRWPLKIIDNAPIMLAGFLIIYIVLFYTRYIFTIDPVEPVSRFFMSTMCDESSLTNIVGGFMLFFFFKQIHIKKSPIINSIATGTFAVLLIHDHNFFRYNLWNQIINTSSLNYESMLLPKIVAYSIWIFFVCYVIEKVRVFVLEKNIFKNSYIIELSNRINTWINNNNS